MTIVSEDVTKTEDRISGWVLKGSEVVNAVACRRFGILEKDIFHSFRQREDKEPSAVYPLHARCEVSQLDQRDILVRAKGKNTFVAIVAGKYEKIDGYQFSVSWPVHGQSRSNKSTRLILGFETETTAARWQTAFLTSIERLAMIAEDAEISSPPMPMPMDSPQHAAQKAASKNKKDKQLDTESDFAPQNEDPHTKGLSHIQSNNSFHDVQVSADITAEDSHVNGTLCSVLQVEEDLSRTFSFNSSAASGQLPQEPGTSSSARSRPYGFWSPWKLVNGLAIYREDDPSQGVEAFMVSCIVRATPTTVFDALMDSSKDASIRSTGFLDMNILDKINEDADFVHSRFVLQGRLACLLAPREIVLDRNWRKEEEDGTYIVMMKSSDKFFAEEARDQPCETMGECMWNPVRAQVLACVFTVAPLQDKYFNNSKESPEALLTMVLKIDLGGILSPSHPMNLMMRLSGIREAWIESLLMSVVTLKDRVEQSRFVSTPFSSDTAPIPQGTCAGFFRPASSLCNWTRRDQEDLSGLVSRQSTQIESSQAVREPSVALDMTTTTGTCDPAFWMCPGAAGYRVRGRNYLIDKKKILAPEPVFSLIAVDLVKLDQPTQHIAQHLPSVQNSPSAFSFVVQIMVPGPPHLALVLTWGSRDDSHSLDSTSMSLEEGDISTEAEHELPPFDLTLMRFFTGDDEVRNASFKLIPHIVKGSFIIRQSVGSTPVLLGKKLKQYYFKSAKYIEVDVDVGSSYTAATVVNMVSGVTKTLVVDLAIVLEGKTQQELPESLLGTVRLDRIDLSTAVYLNTQGTHEQHPSTDSTAVEPDEPMP